jgi:hypothetical protein
VLGTATTRLDFGGALNGGVACASPVERRKAGAVMLRGCGWGGSGCVAVAVAVTMAVAVV